MTEFMRESDAFTWAMESDPRLRSTVVTWCCWIGPRTGMGPRTFRLNQPQAAHVSAASGGVAGAGPAPLGVLPATSSWTTTCGGRPPRRPAPSTTVLEMARLAEMQDFDRARALWETTLVDGLENGGAAMICKFHHALTDGVGGVQIAMTLFDLSEDFTSTSRCRPSRRCRARPGSSGYRTPGATTPDWWVAPWRAR